MRKTVNACIAVIFIVCICTVTVLTLSEYGRKYAYGFFKSYKDRLDDDSDIFDNVEARIYKLNYNAENRLWGRDALRHLTVRFQMALPGKDIVSIGGASMVHLTSGGYYNLMDGPLAQSKIDDITEFAEKAADMSGAKTLFVYCHCALFEDGLLPGDTRYLDNNGAFADEMLASLSANGVQTTDSRASYVRAGLTMDEAANKSDVHWTHIAALETAYDAARALSDMGINADYAALERSRFTDEVHPSLLMGEYARRVGNALVIPDDVHVLYPSYDTCVVYEELNYDYSYAEAAFDEAVLNYQNAETDEKLAYQYLRRDGTFREAVINYDNLAPDEGGYSSTAYYIYGHYLAQTHTHNESAPESTVLVFKDSYGTPVSAFLALSCRDVYAVDLRSTHKTMLEWVEEIRPDAVIFAYSQQMLRDIEYVIDDGTGNDL